MTDLFNQMDGYNFDDYFNALISPVSENTKRQEIPTNMNNLDIKYIPKVEHNLPMQNLLIPNGAVNINGMMMVPVNLHPNMSYVPINPSIKKSKKRKSIKEPTKNVITTSSESLEEIPASPTKKIKRIPKYQRRKRKHQTERELITALKYTDRDAYKIKAQNYIARFF